MEAVRCDNGRPFFMERLMGRRLSSRRIMEQQLMGRLMGRRLSSRRIMGAAVKKTAVMNLSCGCFVYIRKIF